MKDFIEVTNDTFNKDFGLQKVLINKSKIVSIIDTENYREITIEVQDPIKDERLFYCCESLDEIKAMIKNKD